MTAFFHLTGSDDGDEGSGENSFMELYEKSLKSIQEGELVTARCYDR
jgi:hypothetical protein